MTAGVRVAVFAALLAVVFAVAVLAARAIEPGTGSRDAAAHEHAHAPTHQDAPAGLSLAQDGLRLVATEHGRRMHLIVVRRDLTGYQHLHPAQARDGIWRAPLHVPAAGAYREVTR
jgi:hypothetical protein